MHARPSIAAAVLAAPVALVLVGGPLAGAAVADRPDEVHGELRSVAGTLRLVSIETHGNTVVTTFTESTADTGDVPGTTTTTWTCARREGTSTSRCTGEGQFVGTKDAVVETGEVRATATCTESGAYPSLFVRCEGRLRLVGTGTSDGLHGHATWQSAGLFGLSVTGTSEMRLHHHR